MPNTALNRTVVVYLTNKSGGALAYGDVVVVDTANASAVTTTTTTGYISTLIGVCIEPNGIAADALGLIATAGYLPKITLNTAATVGQFIRHHSVAKQGTPHSAPMLQGDFAIALTASATPEAVLFGSALPAGSSLGTPDTGWSVSNVTTDKAYDADSTTVNELADVLGSLIAVLISKGVLSA